MTKTNKRIAILIDTLNGGGAEKICITLYQGMKKLGVDAHLIVLKSRCEYELEENESVHFIFDSSKVRLYSRRIRKMAVERLNQLEEQLGRFDACYSNLDQTHQIVSESNLDNCYYVIHNSIDSSLSNHRRLGPIKYWRYRRAINSLNGKRLIAVSKGIQSEIESSKAIKAESVQTIYNPFDIPKIRLMSEEKDESIPARPYILFVGRIARQKRIDVLIKAFQLIEKDVDLLILTNNLKKLEKFKVRYNSHGKNIYGLSFKQNPYPLIKNAECLVISSDHEGLSTVLIESLICGTNIVSTNCPHGADEILTGELKQFLSAVGDVECLARNIDKSIGYALCEPEIIKEVKLENIVQQYLVLAS